MTLEQVLSGSIFQFMMVFARLGSAVMLMPGFGEAYVPPRIRLVAALMISLALMPMVGERVPAMPADLPRFVVLLGGEIGIGLFFGTITRLILMALQSAGMVVALQVGIANALSVDPTTAQQGAVSGNFLLAVGLVLIFSTGLDHTTIRALAGTYDVFVPGQLPPMQDIADFIARTSAVSFELGLQLAAPFLVCGIVFTVGLGLLARLMPTLQVFFIAMPLQIMAGIGLLAVSVTSMMIWFLNAYERQMAPFLGN